MYGTADKASTELVKLDEHIAEMGGSLREVRRAIVAHKTQSTEIQFALNTIVQQFLGLDCAVADKVDVLNKLTVGCCRNWSTLCL